VHYSLPVAVSNPDLTAIRDRLEEKVSEEAERLRVPGVAVGVWASGEEQYVCHGVTTSTTPSPVDERTLFQIGLTVWGKPISVKSISSPGVLVE
jgi:CubicO group peptidase (beta-lactamase class C family)